MPHKSKPTAKELLAEVLATVCPERGYKDTERLRHARLIRAYGRAVRAEERESIACLMMRNGTAASQLGRNHEGNAYREAAAAIRARSKP